VKPPPTLTPRRALALLGLFIDYPDHWSREGYARKRIREELEQHVAAGLAAQARRKAKLR
jgi:hypothetical protein